MSRFNDLRALTIQTLVRSSHRLGVFFFLPLSSININIINRLRLYDGVCIRSALKFILKLIMLLVRKIEFIRIFIIREKGSLNAINDIEFPYGFLGL